jgi:hypothetical protein
MIKIFIEDESKRYQSKTGGVEPVLNEIFVETINEAQIRWVSAILQCKEFYAYKGGEQIGANTPENRAYFNFGA